MGPRALRRAGQRVKILQRYRDITPQSGAVILTVPAHEETDDGGTNVEGASDAAQVPDSGYRYGFCERRSLRFDTRGTANARRRPAARHQAFESAARHGAGIEGQCRATAGRIREGRERLMYRMDRWLPFLRQQCERSVLFDARHRVPVVGAALHAALKHSAGTFAARGAHLHATLTTAGPIEA